MGRVIIAKKAILNRLNNIISSYPGYDSYTGYIKLLNEIKKLRDDVLNDEDLYPDIKEKDKE